MQCNIHQVEVVPPLINRLLLPGLETFSGYLDIQARSKRTATWLDIDGRRKLAVGAIQVLHNTMGGCPIFRKNVTKVYGSTLLALRVGGCKIFRKKRYKGVRIQRY